MLSLLKISNTSEKKSDESVRVFEIMELLSESRYLNVAEVKTSGSEYTFSYVISDLRPWTGHMYMVAQREEGPGLVDQSDPCPINSCWTREAGEFEEYYFQLFFICVLILLFTEGKTLRNVSDIVFRVVLLYCCYKDVEC